MKKTCCLLLVCFLLLLVSCNRVSSGEQNGVLPDNPTFDPLRPNGSVDQNKEEGAGDVQKPIDEEQTELPDDSSTSEEDDAFEESEIDVYLLQNERGEEVLSLYFYEGTYTLKVNTTHTGSYTSNGNCVTLDIFDVQNTWTVQDDGSMTLGHNGEWSELVIGTFSGESAYGQYTLTLHDDGTFVLEQDENSRGNYLIVDGYTILKRDRYGEENLYLITDRESGMFYYTE